MQNVSDHPNAITLTFSGFTPREIWEIERQLQLRANVETELQQGHEVLVEVFQLVIVPVIVSTVSTVLAAMVSESLMRKQKELTTIEDKDRVAVRIEYQGKVCEVEVDSAEKAQEIILAFMAKEP